jgi:electron transfer flavoprotein beta subunit
VKKSFTKAVKGKGTVVTLDPEESAGWLVDRLSEKFII